ncbi:MAG: substrate-binding domain-containing protein, partial [Alphaproteobacteria bacterium]|nr:substrate-binding domain-containing protein [Alphaproteobacteria bacterium]
MVMNMLEARGIPIVRIAPVSFAGRTPAVIIDDAAAAGEVARHFRALGHSHFGIINGPIEHGAAGTRRTGFIEALGRADCAEATGGFLFAGGIEAAYKLLRRDARPTAIFATNDDMAAGVYAAANKLGLKVPQDVSVIGFDDSWTATCVWPGLTTIYQPITEMAHEAARLLIMRESPREDVVMAYHLVERASTAPPALAARGPVGVRTL